ncbi:vascular endothelial growth factor A precursor [Xenopus tropicalis]|uniref:Vascular endothelial growth factor A precursor n=2 Tax=Xenopus tropicalis TaxID=8364 RepID=B0BMQ3_XENTR|nr:vascular endothelial growth factor A, long form precursor [Xenopus tropicalis]AAI58523.1 vegfa protein [Xenopus tropicalis]|eukprot:NP_001107704.1 vascular endothelial growth factor A precursor [Xenopus tropicalis]
MNFLPSWIHWGLAVLLYIPHAQLSGAAPMPGEGDHKPTEVVKFLKVYERSMCQVREILVDIFQEYPDEVEYIFKPSCVPLMRCAGCCNDESLECVPTESYNITMQIMKIKPHISQHIMDMSFQQHSQCECRPKKEVKSKQENHCEPCTEKSQRKHLFVQDPQTCKCSCKNTDSRCKARQLELNERTCRLVSTARGTHQYQYQYQLGPGRAASSCSLAGAGTAMLHSQLCLPVRPIALPAIASMHPILSPTLPHALPLATVSVLSRGGSQSLWENPIPLTTAPHSHSLSHTLTHSHSHSLTLSLSHTLSLTH